MKRRVTFRAFGSHLASSRLRAEIPQRELASLGFEPGNDVLVIGKHGWDWDTEARGYRRVVFDVCDDHFDGVYGTHYMDACAAADAVTCNSREMARIVKARTGRDAWVIPDPWEAPECKPRVSDALLWFGHGSNLGDLAPWVERLAGRRLAIVSSVRGQDRPGVTWHLWSPQEMDRQFAIAGLVIIPTGKSMAKSGNRAIEAIRRGLYPICGYLPAYGDLGVWVGDVADGVEWALEHHDETLRRIRAAQDYVRWNYAPQRIAKLWLEALSYV